VFVADATEEFSKLQNDTEKLEEKIKELEESNKALNERIKRLEERIRNGQVFEQQFHNGFAEMMQEKAKK
jgi:cell division protein FtsB